MTASELQAAIELYIGSFEPQGARVDGRAARAWATTFADTPATRVRSAITACARSWRNPRHPPPLAVIADHVNDLARADAARQPTTPPPPKAPTPRSGERALRDLPADEQARWIEQARNEWERVAGRRLADDSPVLRGHAGYLYLHRDDHDAA